MRYSLETETLSLEFKNYSAAFNKYMEVRDDAQWLYVFDNLTGEYLICENCSAR